MGHPCFTDVVKNRCLNVAGILSKNGGCEGFEIDKDILKEGSGHVADKLNFPRSGNMHLQFPNIHFESST